MIFKRVSTFSYNQKSVNHDHENCSKKLRYFFSLRMIWTVNVFVNCHFTVPFASHLPTFSRFFNFLTRFEVEIYTENTPRKMKLVEYIIIWLRYFLWKWFFICKLLTNLVAKVVMSYYLFLSRLISGPSFTSRRVNQYSQSSIQNLAKHLTWSVLRKKLR